MARIVRRPVLFGLPDCLPTSRSSDARLLHQLSGGNSGNLAFTAAIRRCLIGWGDQINVRWKEPPSRLSELGDICVIPAANQLGSHMNMGWLADKVDQVDIPVVVVGLGVQAGVDYPDPKIPVGTLRWVKAIADRAPSGYGNLGVRGEFSRQVLVEHGFGGVHVLGCPSLFLNPSARLGRLIQRKLVAAPTRIAVAAGHPGWHHLARLERSLTRMVTTTEGAYFCQAPLAMVALARGEVETVSSDELQRCLDYIDPSMSLGNFEAWVRRYAVVSYDVWEWMDLLRGFDFVVGTRIHGVVLGLQAGVPSLCIVSDSRTRELCETMHVPHVFAHECRAELQREDLAAMFSERFDANRFDANRRTLARATGRYFRANGLTASLGLRWLGHRGLRVRRNGSS